MFHQRILSQLPPDTTADLLTRLQALPEHATLIRDRKGQTVYKITLNDRQLFAKHYQMPKLSSRCIAALGASRARRSYQNGFKLLAAGITTPRPLLILESGFPVPQNSYIVTEWQTGRHLSEHLQDHPSPHANLVTQISSLVTKLHGQGFSHGDFHAKNFLIDDNGTLILIDLDNVRTHLCKFRLRRRYDRDRTFLLESVEAFPAFAQDLDEALPMTI